MAEVSGRREVGGSTCGRREVGRRTRGRREVVKSTLMGEGRSKEKEEAERGVLVWRRYLRTSIETQGERLRGKF